MKKKAIVPISIASGIIIIGVVLLIAFNSNSVNHLFAKDTIGASKPPVTLSPQIKALNEALVAVCDAVVPTIVNVNVVVEETGKGFQIPDQFKDFYEFFGIPSPQEDGKRRSEGNGSGVIVSEDGYIVTNNHVVENATLIKVTTYDKREYTAKLIGADPYTDLALIKIEAKNLPTVHFADINSVKVGEIVLAIGNPLGLNFTVTNGIISAIGRGGLSLYRDPERRSVEYFIQTDAPINPGNSGGGLFNLEGSLVGINTAIATRTGSYIGYGFAIPVDLVKAVVLDLIEDGKINRGYFGIRITSVDEVTAKSVGLDKIQGALVNDVIKGKAADKAGIEPGDIILEVDGRSISTSNELQSAIVTKRAGDVVNVVIWRDGKKITKKVKLEPLDEDDVSSSEEVEKEQDTKSSKFDFDKLGFSVADLTPEQKKDLDVEEGVYITNVKRYSPAAERGLSPGGVIISVDRKKVSSVKELKNILKSKKPGDAVMFNIKYKNTSRIIAIEIPE